MSARRIPGITLRELIPIDDPEIEGTYKTWWGHGTLHAKVEDPTKPLMLAHELIGSRLAAHLGLPTLPGEIARLDEASSRCWVTPQIAGDGGVTPPAPLAEDIIAAHPGIVAGMVVFDAWIHNQDRHEWNVLHSTRLGIWLIDHENSLLLPDGSAIGTPASEAARTPLGYHGFIEEPLDLLAVRYWEARVREVRNQTIERVLDEAHQRGLIVRKQAQWLETYLRERRDNISKVLPKLKNVPFDENLFEPTELNYDEGEGG